MNDKQVQSLGLYFYVVVVVLPKIQHPQTVAILRRASVCTRMQVAFALFLNAPPASGCRIGWQKIQEIALSSLWVI